MVTSPEELSKDISETTRVVRTQASGLIASEFEFKNFELSAPSLGVKVALTFRSPKNSGRLKLDSKGPDVSFSTVSV